MQGAIERGMRMREFKVSRADLLKKITQNREKHIAEYREAVVGYKVAATAKIKEALEKATKDLGQAADTALRRVEAMSTQDIEDGPSSTIVLLSSVHFNLQVPQNHEKEYDAVISAMTMCVEDNVMLRTDEHACWIMDDWDWKMDFRNTSKLYSNNNAS